MASAGVARIWSEANNLSADGVPVRRNSSSISELADDLMFQQNNFQRDVSPEIAAVTATGYPINGDRERRGSGSGSPRQGNSAPQSNLCKFVCDPSYERTMLFLFFAAFWLIALDSVVLSFTLGVRQEPSDDPSSGRSRYSLPEEARNATDWTQVVFPIIAMLTVFDAVARLKEPPARWSSVMWHWIDFGFCFIWAFITIVLVNFELLFGPEDDLARSNAYIMRVFFNLAFLVNLWRRIQGLGKMRRDRIPMRVSGRPMRNRSQGPIPVIGIVMDHQESLAEGAPGIGVADGIIVSRENTQYEGTLQQRDSTTQES